MGPAVGSSEGTKDGIVDGLLLGPTDGDALGSPDGSELGPNDGRIVGAVVIGDADGLSGVTVGFADGSALGLPVTGAFVGATELGSCTVGSVDGTEVGVSVDSIGPLEGRPVGSKDGSLEGISLGSHEGCEVGSLVTGIPVGCPSVTVGLAEGDSVGSTLGVLLGLSDGLSVGSSVASSFGSALDVVDPEAMTDFSVRFATYSSKSVELRKGSNATSDASEQFDKHDVLLTCIVALKTTSSMSTLRCRDNFWWNNKFRPENILLNMLSLLPIMDRCSTRSMQTLTTYCG